MNRKDVLFFTILPSSLLISFFVAFFIPAPFNQLANYMVIILMGPLAWLNVSSRRFQDWAYVKVNIRKVYLSIFVVLFAFVLTGFMFLIAYLNGTMQ